MTDLPSSLLEIQRLRGMVLAADEVVADIRQERDRAHRAMREIRQIINAKRGIYDGIPPSFAKQISDLAFVDEEYVGVPPSIAVMFDGEPSTALDAAKTYQQVATTKGQVGR